MVATDALLEQFIETQRMAVRYHILWTVGVFTVGVAVIVATFTLIPAQAADAIKLLSTLAGGCISTFSTFPLKEVITRKERINAMQSMAQFLPEADESTRAKISEVIWKTLEKAAIG